MKLLYLLHYIIILFTSVIIDPSTLTCKTVAINISRFEGGIWQQYSAIRGTTLFNTRCNHRDLHGELQLPSKVGASRRSDLKSKCRA